LAAALFLSACADVPRIVVTAHSMQALNDSFAGTADVLNAAYDAHHITPEQYAKWKAFGLRFQASAPIAEKLYDAALASKDDSVRGHAEAILHDFEAELGEYIALSLRVAHPDGGP
jgi:hypothetical protein